MVDCTIILVVLATILVPPLGVLYAASCGADIVLNIFLTLCGYFPGHIHAFYLLYIYYDRMQRVHDGEDMRRVSDAPLVFSDRVQTGADAGAGIYADGEGYPQRQEMRTREV